MLIVCNGMFRSGSTLQYNLVRELVERLGIGKGRGLFDGEQIRADQGEFGRWIADDKYHITKSHKVPRIAVNPGHQDRIRILYTFRDLRDVAVSLKRRDGYADCSDVKLLGILDAAVSIHKEVTRLPNALIQRYEVLAGDLNGGVAEIAEFLGLSPNPEMTREVVDACSQESADNAIKRAKRRRKIRESWLLGASLRRWKILRQSYDPRTLLHGNHISSSRGASVWKDVLSPDEIRLLTGRYREWLEATGYASK